MLNTLRSLNESSFSNNQIITEQESEGSEERPSPESYEEQHSGIEVVNDVEIKILSTDKTETMLNDQEKGTFSQLVDSFRQQVDQLAELDPGFTFNNNQIRLDGSIDELSLNFVLIIGKDEGLYITSSMMEVNDEVTETIEKLVKIFPTFTSSLEPILRTRKNG